MMPAGYSGLNSHVLVLNKHYSAVRIVSARRAMAMLFRRIVEIVYIEDSQWQSYDFESWREVSEFHAAYQRDQFDWIRCIRFDIAVPKIIRLLQYDRLPNRHIKFNRRNIFARDDNRCQYCGKRFPVSELSLDHVMPRSRGGKTDWTNIVCSCVKCNIRKGGRTPQEARMKLITQPIRPKRPPVITIRLNSEKYASWKQFLNTAYWNVELRDL